MRISKLFRKIIISIFICGALIWSPQISYAISPEDVPSDGVIIGFIDSGIATYNLDASHVLEGRNYVFENKDTSDRIGHGTKTAGMVLGSLDGKVSGTCPEAYLVPLVVVDKYASGVTSNGGIKALVAALYDAVDVYNCRVINISLSTTEESSELKAAVNYAVEKGAIIICSSGNTPNSPYTYYPAHYDNVITVGASAGDGIASFSTTSDTDFFYEGSCVSVVDYRKGRTVSADSGTSFSCASVAGICASWLAQDPALSFSAINDLLRLHCLNSSSGILKVYDKNEYALHGIISHHCSDIEGKWYQAAVEYALSKELIKPYADGTFRADEKATRAETVYALYQLSGAPSAGGGKNFTDVAEDAWYSQAVAWASENDIVSGYTNGCFGPHDKVTREQLCTILCKYARFKGIDLRPTVEKIEFADGEMISSYAVSYIETCQRAGIVTGRPGSIFDPKGSLTRGELSSILMNYPR